MSFKGDLQTPAVTETNENLTVEQEQLIATTREKMHAAGQSFFDLIDGRVEPDKENLLRYARLEREHGQSLIQLQEQGETNGKIVLGKVYFPDLRIPKEDPHFMDSLWADRERSFWTGVSLDACLKPPTQEAKGFVSRSAILPFSGEIGWSIELSQKLHKERKAGTELRFTPPEFWDNRLVNSIKVVEAIYRLAEAPLPPGIAEEINKGRQYLANLKSPEA